MAALQQPSASALGQLADDTPNKKKKKGKKKKRIRMTKKEKLDKAAKDLRQSRLLFAEFVHKLEQYAKYEWENIHELCELLDPENTGVVAFDEFKGVLRDTDSPFSPVQLHLLCHILDRNQMEQVWFKLIFEVLDELRSEVFAKPDPFPAKKTTKVVCPECNWHKWSPPDNASYRFVSLELRMFPFDTFKTYPGHLPLLVHDHVTIFSLIQYIQNEAQIAAQRIYIFPRKGPHLSIQKTLAELEFPGGPFESPTAYTLYYDYDISDMPDCPILKTDHFLDYRMKKLTTKGPNR